MSKILIIDDDEDLCRMMLLQFRRMGYDVAYAHTLEDGLGQAASNDFDVVFLDVGLPDGDGLEALPRIREMPSLPEVIIFTSAGDPDGAEKAIESGAWDYIEKPLSLKAIALPLSRAIQYRREKKKSKPKLALRREGIIGNSPQIQECLDLTAEAAGSEENVLITGETGTGKELFASAIHKNSDRSSNSFVVVDCAALPETLVEGILFGHEKGAFTGADKASPGLIKQADGGSLFLDEVGELPLRIQKSFLRVIQEHRFRPVGSQRETESDFRLLAATNRDLDRMVKEGLFREDLLFRLRSLKLGLPPLRERAEDIKALAINHLGLLAEKYGIEMKGISPEFLESLVIYDWPGNVRELHSTLERTLVHAKDEPILFTNHLPTQIRVRIAQAALKKSGRAKGTPTKKPEQPEDFPSFKEYRKAAVDATEREYLKRLLHLSQKDIEEACSVAEISRSRLYFLLRKYDLTVGTKETAPSRL